MAVSISTKRRREMSGALQTSDAVRMDRHYRYQRHIYNATRTHYLIGRKHLIQNLNLKPGQSVLEMGCGTAWNLVRIAKKYPKGRVFGADVSSAMLNTAQNSVQRRGLEKQITLGLGDATSFDSVDVFGVQQFDRVFFSYAISMIPEWEHALEHATGLVAPDGELHVIDFGQCEELPVAFKQGLFAFLRYYTVHPRADLEVQLAEVAARHDMLLSFQRLHRGYTEYAVLRRKW
jgi:S-adenosylmethionine-diacylgycerolhomoserine-N-methlytransferase